MKIDELKRQQQINNKLFSKLAWLYNYERFILFPLRKKVVKFLNLKSSKKILDVATGTGSQAVEWAKQGHEVYGIDLSRGMLAQAKKKISKDLKITLLQSDATTLPFANNKFDVTSISLALHDMPHEIELLTLEEIKRVTKKNGKIIIVEYLEPENHLHAKLFYPIAKIYETQYFIPFIRRKLDPILKEVKLEVIRNTHFLGLVQIALVKKT